MKTENDTYDAQERCTDMLLMSAGLLVILDMIVDNMKEKGVDNDLIKVFPNIRKKLNEFGTHFDRHHFYDTDLLNALSRIEYGCQKLINEGEL